MAYSVPRLLSRSDEGGSRRKMSPRSCSAPFSLLQRASTDHVWRDAPPIILQASWTSRRGMSQAWRR
jgi:hypothetical protein